MLLATKVGTFAALALIVAVAVILITPDSTDDVDAILHLGKVVHAQALTLVSALNIVLIARASERLCVVGPSNVTSRLLDLLCTCRC